MNADLRAVARWGRTSSELVLQSELHHTGIARAEDSAEVRGVQVRRRIAPLEPVERVEGLEACLGRIAVAGTYDELLRSPAFRAMALPEG